ncbi:MAG: OmpA family protein [Flavobacteriales bacterium]|nr:OmpA family protein [Flavobacteriales bacterium]
MHKIDLFFQSAGHSVSGVNKIIVDSLLHSLSPEQLRQIYLMGFCDSQGSFEYNRMLSQRRVDAVKQYLINNGVSADQIVLCIGVGKVGIAGGKKDAAFSAYNRRVEMRFKISKPLAVLSIELGEDSYIDPAAVEEAIRSGNVNHNDIASDVANDTDTPDFEEEYGFDNDGSAKYELNDFDDFARNDDNAPSNKLNNGTGNWDRPDQVELNDDVNTIADLEIGDRIVLNDLYFKPGRHFLVDESYPELVKLLEVLKYNKDIKIEIQGHVCCLSPKEDAFDLDTEEFMLSHNRAKYVYEYLTEQGIDSSRLGFKGFGTSHRIILSETSESEKNLNRRVEIQVVE